jgi:SAM-dependent methyltransferase
MNIVFQRIRQRLSFGRKTWDPVKYWSGRASDPASMSVMWTNLAYNELVDRDEWHVIVRHIGSRRGDALDLGCGTGRMSARLADRFQRYTGVDLEAMVEEARRRNPSLADRYVAATVETYDYPPESFDFVLSLGCLATACSADGLRIAARRIVDTTRASGRIVLIEPFHKNRALTRGCRITPRETASLFEDLGASLVALDGMLFPPLRMLLSESVFGSLPTVTRVGYEIGEMVVRLRPVALSDYSVIVLDKNP